MFLKHLDLTTALRPSYLPDEVLLFVQDNVGLYEGKAKLPSHQNGQVYLTSHRICYVDKGDPRRSSVAVDLKNVDRYEFYAGFIKSSPKITLVPKPARRGLAGAAAGTGVSSPVTRATGSHSGSPAAGPGQQQKHQHQHQQQLPLALSQPRPPAVVAAHWVCTICTFSNPVPTNFDPHTATLHTPLPPCLTCGIKPALTHVLKAAISSASNRVQTSTSASSTPGVAATSLANPSNENGETTAPGWKEAAGAQASSSANFPCPSCTFLNHPSLLSCEMCSTPLRISDRSLTPAAPGGAASPSPSLSGIDTSDSIKISFRGGGDRTFYDRLKDCMTQRKWLLDGAPPIPKHNRLATPGGNGGEHAVSPASVASGGASPGPDRVKTAGIAGLEQLGLHMRRTNDMIIGNAFEDLEALMASAKEVVELAERFARQTASAPSSAEASTFLAESAASQLGLVTTKDIVGSSSESLYVSELARNLAEFLTDDARGVLRRSGGVITLIDLWALFNRARGGVELVSPTDFERAARMWDGLRLPIRLRAFKSGVLVVQARDRTDDATVRALLAWLRDLHEFPPEREVAWDWRRFGRGVTARETAERFGWSIGVAEAELEMAEERGQLCREEGIEGLRFWENFLVDGAVEGQEEMELADRVMSAVLIGL